MARSDPSVSRIGPSNIFSGRPVCRLPFQGIRSVGTLRYVHSNFFCVDRIFLVPVLYLHSFFDLIFNSLLKLSKHSHQQLQLIAVIFGSSIRCHKEVMVRPVLCTIVVLFMLNVNLIHLMFTKLYFM